MQVQINKQENEYSDKRSKNNTNWQRKACKRTWLMHLNLGWVSETSFMKEKKEKKVLLFFKNGVIKKYSSVNVIIFICTTY